MLNNLYLVGVGGQGVIRLGQIIAAYAMEEGQKVKFFKQVGMAQRGGAVHCEVRIGDAFSSRIPPYSADVVAALEMSEALKAAEFIKPGGTVILNKSKVYPIDIMINPETYPSWQEIEEVFKKLKAILINIDAAHIALQIGLPIAENIVMLGAVSFVSSFKKELMIEVLKKNIPHEIKKNTDAFLEGYRMAEGSLI
ncbi:MAG: 2-oxoacid:acceptor oxidoreductase family protein [Atribacterota bacterium]|jgi:indolepyruvate ferredoxin oxidoreductase beta subunit|nr:2-oxoacid:acceptor oxidoreductase family protein [Atribacterota bacterium]MDD4896298.1 2-oxoacid:acceptor oxidoreductase family protein [Atribacterota bacterium]MDD5636689.1 2-oxoacid:acceptor oxidoreductase family protein [Atribacterota bacterium]